METEYDQSKADIKVNVKVPQVVFGGEIYSVSVEIVNTTTKPLNYVYVEAVELPGNISYQKSDGRDDDISWLKNYRGKIREEMRTQAEYALIFYHNVGTFDKLFSPFMKPFFDVLKISSSKIKGGRFTLLPSWSRRAIDIGSVKDAENIESSIINLLPETNRVRLAWQLNMTKFKQYDKEITRLEKILTENRNKSKELPVGSSVTINFKIKAPFLLSPKKLDAIFQIFYDSSQFENQKTISVSSTVLFAASPISIIAGAIIGAFFGFVIRITYLTPSLDWLTLLFCKIWQDH